MVEVPFPLVSSPRTILFWGSGDLVVSLREFPIVKDNKQYLMCFLLPDFYTKQRYSLFTVKDGMDFSMDSQGILIREYPKKLFKSISDSSENPISVAFCRLDGTEVIDDELSGAYNELQRMQNVIDRLRVQLQRYEEEIEEMVDQFYLTKRKQIEVED